VEEFINKSVNIVLLLLGVILLLYNERIGKFQEEVYGGFHKTKIGTLLPWYPRLNTIVFSILLIIGSIYTIIYNSK
jgi:hypothetical protein